MHAVDEALSRSANPAMQREQLELPGNASLSVTHPGWHSLHSDVELALYVPTGQAVQLVALGVLNVSVIKPAEQTRQLS